MTTPSQLEKAATMHGLRNIESPDEYTTELIALREIYKLYKGANEHLEELKTAATNAESEWMEYILSMDIKTKETAINLMRYKIEAWTYKLLVYEHSHPEEAI